MYLILDLETTGRVPCRHEILTIGAIVANKDLVSLGEFHRGVQPNEWQVWENDAEKVHGISKRQAAKFKASESVLDDFVSFLGEFGESFSLVCHAVPVRSKIDLFDRNFLFHWFWNLEKRVQYYKLFPEERIISTIKKQRKNAMSEYGIDSQSLDAWIKKLGLDERGKHSAIKDARICLEVLKYQSRFGGLESNL